MSHVDLDLVFLDGAFAMGVIQAALLGLGAGAVYILLAQGVVVIHRGSGVLNLAHGAMAMGAAYVSFDFVSRHGWGPVPAMVAGIVAGTVLGALSYLLVMRPLRRRNTSLLTQTVGTLGILIILEQVAILKFGGAPQLVPAILPTDSVSIGSARVGVDRLWLVAIAAGLTLLLASFYRFTKVGLALRALGDNERAAATLGWSPDVLSCLNWAIGGLLAGVAGVFVAPLSGLSVDQLTLVVVAGLAVVLVANFRSFIAVFVAGILLGGTQSVVSTYWHQQGVDTALPFFVILLIMVLRGAGLPGREAVSARLASLGSGRLPVWLVAPFVALILAALRWGFGANLSDAVTTTVVTALVLLSIVVVTGYGGQLSLAQYSIAGICALVSARLNSDLNWPFLLCLLVGVLVAVPVSFVFGLPALRTRGVNLAVVTLGLGLAVQTMVFDNPWWLSKSHLDVGTPVHAPHVFGINVNSTEHPQYYAMVAVVLLTAAGYAVSRLRRSRAGRRIVAVRTNERAAAALGINVLGAKMYAFIVSGCIVAIAGVLTAFRGGTSLYDGYNPISSITAVAFAVVGGIGWILGALFGAQLQTGTFVPYFINDWLHSIDRYLPLIGGISVVLLLLQGPDGAAAATARSISDAIRRLSRRPTTPARDGESDSAQQLTSGAATSPSIERVPPAHLSLSGVTVRFGGLTAVQDVSFEVPAGKVFGIIGPNGAGKTTLLDAITGFARPSAGTIRLDGSSIDGLPVHQRVRRGVTRSFQSLELFEDLSIRENILAACDQRDFNAYITNLVAAGESRLSKGAQTAVDEFGLSADLDRKPVEVPFGRRRLVAIARAVAVGSSVVLLDEPAAGLDDVEAHELAHLVRRLADDWGMTIVLIEHNVQFVTSVCDRIAVLDHGRQIATGTPDEIRRNPDVIRAYLGSLPNDTSSTDEQSLESASITGAEL